MARFVASFGFERLESIQLTKVALDQHQSVKSTLSLDFDPEM
jgi:hypothetical protein